MKLFAIVFCIAIMIIGLGASTTSDKSTKSDKSNKKAQREVEDAQAGLQNIYDRLELMQKTVQNTWTLDPYIPSDDVIDIRNLADEKYQHQANLQIILDDVTAKINEVLELQTATEEEMKEAYVSHRQERGDEESIITAIQDAINNADLSDKKWEYFSSLQKKLISIHDEFRKYERFVKQAEKKYLDKMFPKIHGCYSSITSAIYKLCGYAREASNGRVFRDEEITAIQEKVQKQILDKFDKGLQSKNKVLELSRMKDTNEKKYREHYDIVKKKLDSIIAYLNREDKK